jgi:predicted lipase
MKYKLHDKVCVHSGFHRQLTTNDVHEELIKNIKDILKENPDYSIYITGHSLGGALSTLFGYILSREIENNIVVVSYASPRVGNYSWKQSFESKENLKHYRITNKRDIVTAFPMYKYHHVGKHIQLSNNKFLTFENCDNKKWYEESIFTCWSPSEHNCELYYKRMNNNIW